MKKNTNKDNKKVDKKQTTRDKVWRVVKFTLFSLSAGIIQIICNVILIYTIPERLEYASLLAYIISLIVSVIWCFTFNRRFTFRSASNVPKAMLLVFAFYLVFAPASIFLHAVLVDGNVFGLLHFQSLNLHPLLGTFICMLADFTLSFFYQRFVVFRKSIDTKVVKKKNKK